MSFLNRGLGQIKKGRGDDEGIISPVAVVKEHDVVED